MNAEPQRKPGLVIPHASPAATREDAMEGALMPEDIPFERTFYRSASGLLLTSSLIQLGIGVGERMTGVSRLTDDEAKDYLEMLDEYVPLEKRTEFERELVALIRVKLGERWT